MDITQEHIEEARRLDACPEALAWLEEQPRTLAELREHNARWLAWFIAVGHSAITPEILDVLRDDRNWKIRLAVAERPITN